MPNTREKLIEVKQTLEMCYKQGITSECNGCAYRGHNNVCMDALMEDALAVINQLESNAPVQKWIPVTERLPEENERVLACYINPLRKDRPPRMMVGEGTSTQIVKGKVYLWCGGWRSITHWMPLPQPPKGE